MSNLYTYLQVRDELRSKKQRARSALLEAETSLQEAEKLYSAAQEALSTAQNAAQHIQNTVHIKVAALVTQCLRAVFGENSYEFVINFDRKRGKTQAILGFVRNGQHIDPMDAAGGGVIDVASFALRLSCLMLHQPGLRKLLVLDEPMKHLSAQYRPAVRQLLESLAEDLDVQFVIVTHDEAFQVGKVIEIQ